MYSADQFTIIHLLLVLAYAGIGLFLIVCLYICCSVGGLYLLSKCHSRQSLPPCAVV